MRKNKDIYVCDFETTSKKQYLLEKRTRVYLWKCVDVNNTIYNRGIDIDSFFNFIYSIQDD